jgi:RNA recognition motif-containing protein
MKLFVAKLPQTVNSEKLRALMEPYGEVIDARVIMDRETGLSKGYGFVEMATDADGKAAIAALDGLAVEGKEILVKESDPAPRSQDRPRGPRPGGRPNFNSGGDRRSSGRSWDDDRPRRYDDDGPRRRRRI